MSESFDAGPDTYPRPMTREDHIRMAALDMAIRARGTFTNNAETVQSAEAFAAFLRGAA